MPDQSRPLAIPGSLGVSPQSTMGYGYSGQRATLVEMGHRWDWQVLHDEMQRRHLALHFSHPGTVRLGVDADGLAILRTPMGSGSAGRAAGAQAVANFWTRWSRTYLPNRPTRMTPEGRAWLKPGMAPIAYPGTSNHEADTWQDRAMAVDNIGWEDGWMGANVHRFGLKTFHNVGREPWHTQPAGMGNSKTLLQADLRRHGLASPPLPKIPHATEPSEEDDMPYLYQPPPGREGKPWFVVGSSSARIATGKDAADLAGTEYRDVSPDGVKRYDLMHESVMGRGPQ